MIHDRWHSHGDLPFDPFMIRQRLPYWMYSLEELRVDLATYGTAGELARAFPFARYVQYAILFDRLMRFPITGNRVRNYDGLGGQLLFGFLHDRGVVNWTDNRLAVDWERWRRRLVSCASWWRSSTGTVSTPARSRTGSPRRLASANVTKTRPQLALGRAAERERTRAPGRRCSTTSSCCSCCTISSREGGGAT